MKKSKFTLRNTLIAVAAIAAVIAIIYATKEQSYTGPNGEFLPRENIHYEKIELGDRAKEILKELNVPEGETFELMTYTCPACMVMDSVLDRFSHINNVNVHKFQIGNDTLPSAESEFMIKVSSPANMHNFRKSMFEVLTSSASMKEKTQFTRQLPLQFGLTLDDLAEYDAQSLKYKALTRELADILEVTSTPSVFGAGKYHIIGQSHSSFTEYTTTLKHVLKLNTPKLKEATK